MARRSGWLVALTLAASTSVGARGQESRPAPQPASSAKADALAAAARKGDAAAVTKLLDEGADVNAKFRYGATALSYAADHGNLDVVKVLVARGADVNVKDTFYNLTPLSWATSPAMTRKPEHAEIVGVLLRAGAQGKDAALLAAVGESDVAMVKIILDVGGLSASNLSDAFDAADGDKRAALVALLEGAGGKPHPVVKLTDAQLTRLAGRYRAVNGAEVVVSSKDGVLAADLSRIGAGATPAVLTPRSETAFAIKSMGGTAVAFRIESDKVTTLTIGQFTFSRVGDL